MAWQILASDCRTSGYSMRRLPVKYSFWTSMTISARLGWLEMSFSSFGYRWLDYSLPNPAPSVTRTTSFVKIGPN